MPRRCTRPARGGLLQAGDADGLMAGPARHSGRVTQGAVPSRCGMPAAMAKRERCPPRLSPPGAGCRGGRWAGQADSNTGEPAGSLFLSGRPGLPGRLPAWRMFRLKRFAFSAIRPAVSRKKTRCVPLSSGGAGLVPRVLPCSAIFQWQDTLAVRRVRRRCAAQEGSLAASMSRSSRNRARNALGGRPLSRSLRALAARSRISGMRSEGRA